MTLKNETKSDVDVRKLMSRNVKKRTFRHVRPMKIHSRILIRNFTGRISDSQWCNNDADAQADLSLRWAHISEGTFSLIAVLIYFETRSWHLKFGGRNNDIRFRYLSLHLTAMFFGDQLWTRAPFKSNIRVTRKVANLIRTSQSQTKQTVVMALNSETDRLGKQCRPRSDAA